MVQRGTTQQVGEMVINDTGALVDVDHEWSVLPSDGEIGIEFTVGYDGSKRRLFYTMTDDTPETATFSFRVGPTFG